MDCNLPISGKRIDAAPNADICETGLPPPLPRSPLNPPCRGSSDSNANCTAPGDTDPEGYILKDIYIEGYRVSDG